ncbi:MAG TPA: hypothetical protein VKB67_10935 [Rhizomicrobium sp.]|nr:hypothetical protein [Rhizomicrobium sp.]
MKTLFMPLSHDAGIGAATERDGDDWFRGGPLSGRFSKPGIKTRSVRYAMLTALLGWFPLAILTALQSLVVKDGSFASFITDYGVLARSLISAPLLVLGEDITARHLSILARYFRDAGPVREKDQPRFREIVQSTRRLRDSRVTELAMVAIALGIAVGESDMPLNLMPAWHHLRGGGSSTAGLWHQFVSLPILLFLLLGWFWRLILWARFLFKVSRLDLRLIPSHPDGAAGLKFVGLSLESLSMGPAAMATILAGTIANRVLHMGEGILSFRHPVIEFIVAMLVLVAGPVLFFTPKLMDAMHHGTLKYGAIARAVGQQWEQRWLDDEAASHALHTADFISTNSLYTLVGRVYTMRIVPMEIRNLAVVVLASVVPFIPAALTKISPMTLVRTVSGFFL